jgi:uncharacterized membrane protein
MTRREVRRMSNLIFLALVLVSCATLGMTLHGYQEARRRAGLVWWPQKQRDRSRCN